MQTPASDRFQANSMEHPSCRMRSAFGVCLLPWRLEQLQNFFVLNSYKSSRYHCRLKKLRSLKTALMQDLLTGKVRVTPLLDGEEAGG
jgi:hypothetical protein